MIFDGLSHHELADLENIGVVRKFSAGNVILEEGGSGSSFFLILSGRVEIRKKIGLDKYKKLAELLPCGLFGEMAFLGVQMRSANVVALEECQLLEFERGAFESLVERFPALGARCYKNIARELAQRLSQSDEDLKDAIVWALSETSEPRPDPEVGMPLRRPKLHVNPLIGLKNGEQ